jgi:hypothetical protein
MSYGEIAIVTLLVLVLIGTLLFCLLAWRATRSDIGTDEESLFDFLNQLGYSLVCHKGQWVVLDPDNAVVCRESYTDPKAAVLAAAGALVMVGGRDQLAA